MPTAKNVAVVGASSDRSKYGNKSVRAHQATGWNVYPVNPHEAAIEGLPVFKSLSEIPVRLDRVTFYVPPAVGITLLADVARTAAAEFFLNPGAESPELESEAKRLGLDPILACSIVD